MRARSRRFLGSTGTRRLDNTRSMRVRCLFVFLLSAAFHAPMVPSAFAEEVDPYLTDATWLGFRIVRPLAVPSVEEMLFSWNNSFLAENLSKK